MPELTPSKVTQLLESTEGESSTGKPWSIVLAGGTGTRMQSFVRAWLGNDTPKQFCAFTDSGRSMLERAFAVSGAERTLVIATRGQEAWVRELPCQVLVQPAPRGTLGAIMLGVSRIMASDPQAVVHLLPADHFIFPTGRFLGCLEYTAEAVAGDPELFTLLGAVADYAETDYGWIRPGAADGRLQPVTHFHEKPAAAEAHKYMADGCLWNTMISTFSAATLWSHVAGHFPEAAALFTGLRRDADWQASVVEADTLGHVYGPLGELDYSRDLLERVAARTAVMPMQGVHWSDWGRPARIVETLRQIGEEPAFAPALAGSELAAAS